MSGEAFYRSKPGKPTHANEEDTDTLAGRTAIWDEMLPMPGKEHTFLIERDAQTIARDGLDMSLSAAAVAHLGWLMSAWVGTRLMRTWMHDDIAPQKVTVTVSVEIDGVPRILIPNKGLRP